MRPWQSWAAALLLLAFFPGGGRAAEEGPERAWTDEAELSYVKSSGNSQLETLAARNLFKLKHDDNWQSSLKLAALNGQSDGTRTSESYKAELRSDYVLSRRSYALIIGGWLKDSFAGIEARYNLGPGLGYKWLTGARHVFNNEVGLEYVHEKNTDDTRNDFLRGRLFALYEYNFSKKNRFSQSLEYLYDFDVSSNYNINSVSAITSALNSYWSLKAGYEIKYDNRPTPSSLEKKDSITTIALVLNI